MLRVHDRDIARKQRVAVDRERDLERLRIDRPFGALLRKGEVLHRRRAGAYHTLALKGDGTVWAWGWNGYGQLGDGTTSSHTTANQVSGVSGVVAIAGGGFPQHDELAVGHAEDMRSVIGGERAAALTAGRAVVPGVGLATFAKANEDAIGGGGGGGGGGGPRNRRLYRLGTAAESATKLADDAARAERNGFPHGVSVFEGLRREDAVSALQSDIEKSFKVAQTGRNLRHYTIELPKPVSETVADQFNRMFGRKR